jgi:glycosyltransferase involved in cell wall biosynthesis
MKIAWISDEHFPHTGADTEVIVNTVAALGARGARVSLIVPWLPKPDRLEAVCAFYGVPRSFELVAVPGWPFPSRAFRLEKLFHGVLGEMHPAVRGADVVHSRDLLPLALAHASGLPWSFETYRRHAEEKPWLPALARRFRFDRSIGAVAHSDASRRDLVEVGFPEDAVITARPGFSLSRFEPALGREEARQKLGLPLGRPIVAYAGNVHVSKGIEQLLEVARRMPDAMFVVVGGAPEEVSALETEVARLRLGNVKLVGHQRPADVPPYLFAADVLFAPFLRTNVRTGFLAEKLATRVLPGTPLKLYGYLAAERPIVAADQPSNRELLSDGENALLFPEGRLDVATDAIRRLLSDRALAERLSSRGRELVKTFTWDERARRLLEFFERRLAARKTNGRRARAD